MSVSKKATAVAMTVGGLVVAGAGVANATTSADAHGVAAGSPGIVAGNLFQVPVNVPVNVVGNTITGAGGLNPTFGNSGGNN